MFPNLSKQAMYTNSEPSKQKTRDENQVSIFFLLKIKISKERRTSSKLSLTDGGNVSHQKSVHSPLSTLPVGIGDTLATFKANQLAIFTNEGPSYFFFFDQNIGRKRSFF